MMRQKIWKQAGVLAVLAMVAVAAWAEPVPAHRITYTSKDNFDIVKSAVSDAITGKGLVINTTSHVGEMLERTGKDLGNAKPIFLHAEGLEFCSATVSRGTMEADPHNIVFCPYVIAIYVLANDPKTTYISFRKPVPVGSKASRAALIEVEKLLRSIIEEATQ